MYLNGGGGWCILLLYLDMDHLSIIMEDALTGEGKRCMNQVRPWNGGEAVQFVNASHSMDLEVAPIYGLVHLPRLGVCASNGVYDDRNTDDEVRLVLYQVYPLILSCCSFYLMTDHKLMDYNFMDYLILYVYFVCLKSMFKIKKTKVR
jgi:hypothetical protein